MDLNKLKNSIVQIFDKSSLYSVGFFFDDQGGILTIANIIEIENGKSEFTVALSNGERYNATFEKVLAKENDLVSLRLRDFKSTPLPICNKEVSISSNIFSLNMSERGELDVREGSIVEIYRPHISISIDTWPGYIGSPIINEDNKCIGILRYNLKRKKTACCVTGLFLNTLIK